MIFTWVVCGVSPAGDGASDPTSYLIDHLTATRTLRAVRALRRFTVRAQLPASLQPLQTLAMNLRWTWHPPTQDLFASLDPDAWERSGHDPVRLLGEISSARFAELAADAETVVTVRELADDLAAYLGEPRWYQAEREDDPSLPEAVGYFSMEFGVSEVLPNYSGGLGMLAGDHLKAASDLGVPLIGVGLLYRSGYFRQSLSLDGWQLETYPSSTRRACRCTCSPTTPGSRCWSTVAMPGGRTLSARVWRAAGRPGPAAAARLRHRGERRTTCAASPTGSTAATRTTGSARRSWSASAGCARCAPSARASGHPAPEVFHTNEGHAGFLGLERIRELQDAEGLDFDEALAVVRAGTVFTTHTPVPAGIDRFPLDMVRHYFDDAAKSQALLPGVPPDRVLALGAEDDPTNVQHGAHGPAAGPAGQRRVEAARRGVSRGMFGELWPRLRHRRGADRLDHQRRARPDLGGAAR